MQIAGTHTAAMPNLHRNSLEDLVKHLGRYPDRAFIFVREGLSYAADLVHGPETAMQRQLHEYLSAHQMDWNDLIAKYHGGLLPEPVVEAIDAAGGCEKLNRHISGRELCWGLRDFALKRWGMLARVVLESWNIRTSRDFGRIVFGFIELDMMQKQADDSIEDFDDIYTFEEAFDEPFRAGLLDNENETAENDEEPDS
jgi:uncharacterized repeat protein (TIGR04138 family)